MDFLKSIEIAQLALKHRPNKNQKQRIILILYSPLAEEAAVLINLAKKAKKNGVAIDVINIGARENLEKLQTFIENVNNADNSHLVHIDIGVASVADVVISSPITQVPGAAGGAEGGAGGAGDIGRVDPNMDPELAEAIRQSLEEQKQMLQAAEAKKEEKKQPVPSATTPASIPASAVPAAAAPANAPQTEDAFAGLSEEEIMQRAIMLSLEGKVDEAKEGQGDVQIPAVQQLAPMAPVSVSTGEKMEVKKQPEKKVDLEAELLKNKDFVSELIKGLPEMTEEDKQKVISSLGQQEQKKEQKKEEKKTGAEKMEDIKPEQKK